MDYNRTKPRKNRPAKKVKPPVRTANTKMKTPAGEEARKNYHLQMKKFNKETGTPVKKRPKPKR
jgi:hypothetical protein